MLHICMFIFLFFWGGGTGQRAKWPIFGLAHGPFGPRAKAKVVGPGSTGGLARGWPLAHGPWPLGFLGLSTRASILLYILELENIKKKSMIGKQHATCLIGIILYHIGPQAPNHIDGPFFYFLLCGLDGWTQDPILGQVRLQISEFHAPKLLLYLAKLTIYIPYIYLNYNYIHL